MNDANLQPDSSSGGGGRLAYLVDRYLDAALSADESAELNALLLATPTARDRFVDLLINDRTLAEAHRPTTQAGVRSRTPAPTPPLSPAGAPIYRKGHEPNSAISNFQFSIFNLQFQLLAAALLAACGLAIYTVAIDADPSGIEHRPSHIEHPPLATLIEATPGSHLTTPGGFISEGRDYPRGEYALSGGTAEFMLTNSVNVKLRGETRLYMRDNMNIALARGSAEFVCPSDASGFTVHLPDKSKIVDLGTRFRVVTDAAGRSLVHVLEGRVDWKQPDGSIHTFDQHQGGVIDAQTFEAWNPNLIFSDTFDHAVEGDARLHRQRGALAPADWKSRVHGSGDGTLDVSDGRLVLIAVPDRSNVESNAVLDRAWEAAGQRVVIEYTVTSDSVGFKHDFKIDPADASRNPASGVTIGARVYPSHVALFIGSQPVRNIQLAEPARRMRWVLDATDPPANAAGLLTLIVNGRELLIDIPYHSEDAQRRVALAVPESPASEATSVAFDDFKISIEPQDNDDATE